LTGARPGLQNALGGLVAILVGVYARGDDWIVTEKIMLRVTVVLFFVHIFFACVLWKHLRVYN
jgi:hypothetical protein